MLATEQSELLDRAYDWLTTDKGIIQCLDAIRRGKSDAWLHAWDTKPTDACEHLEKVGAEAHALGEQIKAAGFEHCADQFFRIDRRLRAVCARGRTDAKDAHDDVIHITSDAESEIERLAPV